MKLRTKIAALLLGLSIPFLVKSDNEGFNWKGQNYQLTYNKKNYGGVRCQSSSNKKIEGWCIVDENNNLITDPNLYSKLSFMLETERDTKLFAKIINESKTNFNKALYAQGAVGISKVVRDVGAYVNTKLLEYYYTGGLAAVPEVKQIVMDAFKDKQKEIYSMYMNKFEAFSKDLLEGKITEDELKTKIKETFENCKEYQLKLAASELNTAQRLINKPNKTKKDYELLHKSYIDGIARGQSALAYFNVMNESATLENSLKIVFNQIKSGVGIQDLEFIVSNPDIERATQEAEKAFDRYYNMFAQNDSYFDISDKNSKASKMLPALKRVQERKEIERERKKQMAQEQKQRQQELQKGQEEQRRQEQIKYEENINWPTNTNLLIGFGCLNYSSKKYGIGFYWDYKNRTLSTTTAWDLPNILNDRVKSDNARFIREIDNYNHICSKLETISNYNIYVADDSGLLVGLGSDGKGLSLDVLQSEFKKLSGKSKNRRNEIVHEDGIEDAPQIRPNQEETPKAQERQRHFVSLKISCPYTSEEYIYDSGAGWVVNNGSRVGGSSNLRNHISQSTRMCGSYHAVVKIDNNVISDANYSGGSSAAADDAEMVRLNQEEYLNRIGK